ncbi:MAG: PAS-domain containing protein, partial [Bradyrhizobium sp.]
MSIRFRLILLVLGTVFLPALLVGGRYYQDRGKEIAASIDGMATTARIIASNFDAKIQGTIQLHFGLSRASDLAAGNKAACSSFLSEVREKNPQYTGILTIAPDGSLFCDSLRTGRSLDLRDRNYFQRALRTVDAAVIEPVFGRLTGSAVLQIAYPARDEANQLKFVLLASLDLNRLIREQIANLPAGAEVVLADRNGMVLDWSPAQTRSDRRGTSIANSELFGLAAENRGQTRELRSADGETQVWAAADTLDLGGVNLHILVGRPKAQLVAAPNRRLAQDAAVLAVISILLFACVSLFAEFGIRSQIARIAKMAARLGAGDLAARVSPPFPRGELGSLMLVLNHTASSLELQRHDIEDLNRRLWESQELEAIEKRRLDIAVNNMTQGLIMYDSSERVVVCNQQFTEMLGLSPDVVKPGCTFREVTEHRRETGSFDGDFDEYRAIFLRDVAAGKYSANISTTADGRSFRIVGRGIEGGGWVATVEDITDRQRFDIRIAHMAHYDALTDLPNRVLFRAELDGRLQQMLPRHQLAVLYIDIDEFKRIN